MLKSEAEKLCLAPFPQAMAQSGWKAIRLFIFVWQLERPRAPCDTIQGTLEACLLFKCLVQCCHMFGLLRTQTLKHNWQLQSHRWDSGYACCMSTCLSEALCN